MKQRLPREVVSVGIGIVCEPFCVYLTYDGETMVVVEGEEQKEEKKEEAWIGTGDHKG